MEPRKRLWIGATLMAVIIFNYILIGAPLLSKSYSINQKTKVILVKQIRSSGIFNNMDDEYMLELFRKERSTINTKIMILNALTVTVTFLALSWTLFGLIFKRK